MRRLAMIGLLAAASAWAHHSTRAAFDDSQIVTMTGVVESVQWLNPHAGLTLHVTDPEGRQTTWSIELSSPIGLMNQGWHRDDLKQGDRVTLGVWVARNGGTRATMRTLTLPDGRTMSGASPWDNPVSIPK